MRKLLQRMKEEQFMFEELVKRDFKHKYKGTSLGMLWSILSPLMTLLIMRLIFTNFFGQNVEHYTTYLFAGTLLFSYFKEQTSGGMQALVTNAEIFSRLDVPKYLFLFSKCVSAAINFGLTLIVFFLFVAIDGVPFHWSMVAIIYPIVMLTAFNVGVGMILSALYLFFKDIGYLYDLFTLLLMYMSAIFFVVEDYPLRVQRVFLLNPIYVAIKYVRTIVLDGIIPSFALHGLLLLYAAAAVTIGIVVYKRNNQKFLYYV